MAPTSTAPRPTIVRTTSSSSAAYVRPVGPVNLTFGALTEALSKFRYEKTRTVNVLFPGTSTNSGNTATYFYNERGADPVDGMEWYLDTSIEGDLAHLQHGTGGIPR